MITLFVEAGIAWMVGIVFMFLVRNYEPHEHIGEYSHMEENDSQGEEEKELQSLNNMKF